ncbi:hypothetical protein ACFP65_00840 [Marinilactibacillus sp. GCM10026970]|uniref:hypothetical protein n=1 Tax=Marinilactibacillus sp. GCM10026970 TaxID=3252642 RepID=UPI00360C7DCF
MKLAKWVILSLFLMGCSSPKTNETVEPVEETNEIISVALTETGDIDQKYLFDSSDEGELEIVNSMLSTATQMDGIVDMIDPNYKMVFEGEDDESETYSIWWEEDPTQLSLMDWVDTHTVFRLEGESARQFEELIK